MTLVAKPPYLIPMPQPKTVTVFLNTDKFFYCKKPNGDITKIYPVPSDKGIYVLEIDEQYVIEIEEAVRYEDTIEQVTNMTGVPMEVVSVGKHDIIVRFTPLNPLP